MTTGEQTSVALMAMALDYHGYPGRLSECVPGADADHSGYGNARLKTH